MGERAVRNPFETFHPAVPVCYLCAVIVFSMAAFHPVYVAISVAGAFVACVIVRGARRAFESLRWIAVLFAVIAVANLLLSASGSTELFRVGAHAFYLEALAFGCTSGGMFAAMVLWFYVWSAVVDGESLLALLGNLAPTVSLIITEVMRLVPQFLRRGRSIAAVQDAVWPPDKLPKRDLRRSRMRVLSVLMGWGMEDGIVRSDAMRARGYECGARRTLYRRVRFRAGDAVALAVLGALLAASAVLAQRACSGFWFYPVVSPLSPWWSYVPYVVFVLAPAVLQAREALRWRSSK